MSAPDSWDQRLDPRVPPGQGGDLNTRFGRMNVNANAFVPNVQAHSFVPGSAGGSGGYGPPYGSYPMHGESNYTQHVMYFHWLQMSCLAELVHINDTCMENSTTLE